MKYLTLFVLFFGLLAAPAMAQDPLLEVLAEEAATEAVTSDAGADKTKVKAKAKTKVKAKVGDPADDAADVEEAVEEAFALVEAIKSKNWPLAVGLILMLLVFAANKFGLKKIVGPKALPWVAMVLAVFGTVGTGLIAGLGWAESLMQGVMAGVVAIGGWELLLKHLVAKDGTPDAPAPPAPDEAKKDAPTDS